jgi:hypothetical protein
MEAPLNSCAPEASQYDIGEHNSFLQIHFEHRKQHQIYPIGLVIQRKSDVDQTSE